MNSLLVMFPFKVLFQNTAPPFSVALLLMNDDPIMFPSFPLSQNIAPPFKLAVLFSNLDQAIMKLVPLFRYIAPPRGALLLMNFEPRIVPFSFLTQPRAPALSVATLSANKQPKTIPSILFI